MYGVKSPYGHPLRYPNPKMSIPAKRMRRRNHAILSGYWKKHFVPSNMRVVGIGVNHDAFVELVSKYFTYPNTPSTIERPAGDDKIVVGGGYHCDVDGMDQVQVNLGLHCAGWTSKRKNWDKGSYGRPGPDYPPADADGRRQHVQRGRSRQRHVQSSVQRNAHFEESES